MPKPAHSHPQSSLQSVWDVGRYLSRYPVAGVAFEAPNTCKQCTPQITAICDGAELFSAGNHSKYHHLQTAWTSAQHCSQWLDQPRGQSHWWPPRSALQHSMGEALERIDMMCAPMCLEGRTCRLGSVRRRCTARAVPRKCSRTTRHQGAAMSRRRRKHESAQWEGRCTSCGNLQTTLVRRSAGAQYL